MAWALITGASSGLGAEFARQLAKRYNLILVARNEARMQALKAQLSGGHEVRVLSADLTQDADVRRVEEAITGEPELSLLVNNAGLGTVGKFHELDAAGEQGEVLLNVNALVRLSHAALGNFIKSRVHGAGIINVGSVAGFQPGPYTAVYAATKSFVKTFSLSIAEEVRGEGIHVQCLCPGFTRTEFQERGHIDVSRLPDFAWMSAEDVVKYSIDNFAPGKPVVVVPGLLNKAMALTSTSIPEAINARLMSTIMKSALSVD
ncbi:MAG TPA: SDR family oxidoreductase [Turneriella sp.]|nr:SDR family oxidoreductase [Turneriella sp.]